MPLRTSGGKVASTPSVQTHVSNIPIKLDLRSRVEVAREYASRAPSASA
jgi:DNA-binding NarL/FixJ family response regulator